MLFFELEATSGEFSKSSFIIVKLTLLSEIFLVKSKVLPPMVAVETALVKRGFAMKFLLVLAVGLANEGATPSKDSCLKRFRA